MSLLKSNTFKITDDFKCGMHTVNLLGFGETEATSRTMDNGDVWETKATIWLKLRNEQGAVDKHTFYYDTEPVMNEETGKLEPAIIERDADNLNRIITAIKKQLPNLPAEVSNDLGEFLTYLRDHSDCKFKVVVSETPSADGKRMWKNFTYSPEVIEMMASIR